MTEVLAEVFEPSKPSTLSNLLFEAEVVVRRQWRLAISNIRSEEVSDRNCERMMTLTPTTYRE